jgi:hypothetical protein
MLIVVFFLELNVYIHEDVPAVTFVIQKVVTYIIYREIMHNLGYFLWSTIFFPQYLDM